VVKGKEEEPEENPPQTPPFFLEGRAKEPKKEKRKRQPASSKRTDKLRVSFFDWKLLRVLFPRQRAAALAAGFGTATLFPAWRE
jgi:hypothetical protein